MPGQRSFSDLEYANRKRITKRESFLKMMDEIIPWSEWIELIRPFYPRGDRGRPPKGIEVMLRMYLVQSWFNLSDAMVEDAIYDSYAIRSFMGLNFHDEQAPNKHVGASVDGSEVEFYIPTFPGCRHRKRTFIPQFLLFVHGLLYARKR